MILPLRFVPGGSISVFAEFSGFSRWNADSIEITKHTAFADVQGIGNLWDLQASMTKFEGSLGDGLCGVGLWPWE